MQDGGVQSLGAIVLAASPPKYLDLVKELIQYTTLNGQVGRNRFLITKVLVSNFGLETRLRSFPGFTQSL